MPMKRERRPGVREGVHLPFHALLLIEKPPAAAKLDLTSDLSVLEVARHCREGIVIHGIHVIDHQLGQGVLGLQAIEISSERGHLRAVADGIEAGVWPELAQAA